MYKHMYVYVYTYIVHEWWTYIVDHKMHDGLGHEVSDRFVYDANVRVHQVADCFHLPLQLRVHRESVCGDIFILHLTNRQHKNTL